MKDEDIRIYTDLKSSVTIYFLYKRKQLVKHVCKCVRDLN
jgi:hypothetical protein